MPKHLKFKPPLGGETRDDFLSCVFLHFQRIFLSNRQEILLSSKINKMYLFIHIWGRGEGEGQRGQPHYRVSRYDVFEKAAS